MTGPASALPPGHRLEVFAALDSTMDEARRRAERGDPGRLWLLAHHQSAGRGRRGRAWLSGAGNLMASLLLRPACGAGEGAQLSFASALAVADALAPFLPERAGIALKWPNDVLLNGRKVAGILLESATAPAGTLDWLVIGIGVNLASHPTGTPFPATSLAAEGGRAPAPETMLVGLAAALERWIAIWSGQGFAPLRAAWLARAAGRGGMIAVRSAADEVHGRFIDLDPEGRLVLGLADGSLRQVAAGEVFFAPADGAATAG